MSAGEPRQPRQIDWASAETQDGTLTVELTGDAPRGWVKRFDGVLALLARNDDGWGEIVVHKQTITVGEVREGAEEGLRHLLDSALQQVNADLISKSDGGDEPEKPTHSEEDAQRASDRRMTDKFRGFAERGQG